MIQPLSSSISTSAFSVPFTHVTKSTLPTTTRTSLFAEKKKRRRRKDSQSSPTESSSYSEFDEDDELPDFDLVEDIDLPLPTTTSSSSSSSSSNTTKKPSTAKATKTMNPNDPAVLAAMQATSKDGQGTTSTKDLLRSRNRELEKKFVLDEIVQDVPSFSEYNLKRGRSSGANSSGNGGETTGSVLGKKALRKEQRIAAAMEAEGKNSEEENAVSQLLNKLPFVGKNDGGKKEEKSPIKVRFEIIYFFIYYSVVE